MLNLRAAWLNDEEELVDEFATDRAITTHARVEMNMQQSLHEKIISVPAPAFSLLYKTRGCRRRPTKVDLSTLGRAVARRD